MICVGVTTTLLQYTSVIDSGVFRILKLGGWIRADLTIPSLPSLSSLSFFSFPHIPFPHPPSLSLPHPLFSPPFPLEVAPLKSSLGVWGSAVSSPAGSGAEPQPKSTGGYGRNVSDLRLPYMSFSVFLMTYCTRT